MTLRNLKEPFRSKDSAAPGGKGPGEGPTNLGAPSGGEKQEGRGCPGWVVMAEECDPSASCPGAGGGIELPLVIRHLLLTVLQAECFPIKAQTHHRPQLTVAPAARLWSPHPRVAERGTRELPVPQVC